jgi:hypothetical protein
MADEIPFRSLTIEEQLLYTDRFASCCSNEFLSDLRYIQEEMGIKFDRFDELCACVASIKQSLLGSTPFNKTLWKNFEESLLTVNHKFNELMGSYTSQLEETIEEDLAEHEHIEQKDLGFMINDFESQGTHDESFRQIEHSNHVIGEDSYESDLELEMAREGFEILRNMFGLDSTKTHDVDIIDIETRKDEVNNTNLQSTPQVLPSFEAYTPPVTYPEEVEGTIGTPIEVEPLEETKLEEIGLNTCSHNLSFSSMEVPSFDEPEPKPKPLPNLPSLDVNLGIELGPDPPIKPYSPGSFMLKVVDSKPCREEADIGVNHNLSYLHHPFMINHKKHYGFKPGLLGQSGFLTWSLSKLIEDDPFLGENLNPPTNPIELGKVMMIGSRTFEHIIHPSLFPHVAYFHPKGVYRYFHPHLILSVGKTSPISVK